MKFFDGILILLKFEFLNIFWFSFWIFIMGEMVFYTLEKLLGYKTIVMWYDLVWLLFIFVFCFLLSYRLYILMTNKND